MLATLPTEHSLLHSVHAWSPVAWHGNAAAKLGGASDAAFAGSSMEVSYGNTLSKPVKVPTRSGRRATDGIHWTGAPRDSPDRQHSVADQVTAYIKYHLVWVNPAAWAVQDGTPELFVA